MKLFIIGNGFDINHGYKTSYLNFRNYLYSNASKYPLGSLNLSDFFEDNSDELWSDFENNLEFIDFKQPTDFYSPNFSGDLTDKEWQREYSRGESLLDTYTEIPENFHPALCRALEDFIIEEYGNNKTVMKKNYFDKLITNDSIYITFNYTKTLEDVYGIKSENINHIHGIAFPDISKRYDDVDIMYGDSEIIFGHANTKNTSYKQINYEFNPIEPNYGLKNLNSHLIKNFQLPSLQDFIRNKDITELEIIGHDIGPVDDCYFRSLNSIISVNCKINYWLYDKTKEIEKRKKLKMLFTTQNVSICYYP